jgi:hypothetical protein
MTAGNSNRRSANQVRYIRDQCWDEGERGIGAAQCRPAGRPLRRRQADRRRSRRRWSRAGSRGGTARVSVERSGVRCRELGCGCGAQELQPGADETGMRAVVGVELSWDGGMQDKDFVIAGK